MEKFLLIVISLLVADVSGDCGAKVHHANMCLQNLMGAMDKLDPANPAAFCTQDIKENMDCLSDFAKACPNAEKSGPFASILPNLEQFRSMCAQLDGQGGGGGSGDANAGAGDINCEAELQGGSVSMCLQDLMNAMQQLDPGNPSAVCTSKVISSMTCLGDFVTACPDVVKSGPFATVVPHIRQFKQMCSMVGGAGAGGGNCPELMACNENVQRLSRAPEMTASGKLTPFSMVPVMVYSLCTVSKQQLMCLDENRSKCPAMVKMSEDLLKESLKRDNTTSISYNDLLTIIRDECPKINPGFPKNQCVRNRLEGQGFVSCIMQVKQLSAKAAREDHCKFYFDGKACMEEHIGKPCGQENARVLVDTAHWVIHDLPQDCDKQKPIMKSTMAPKPGNNGNPFTDPSDEDPSNEGKPEGKDPANAGINMQISLGAFLVLIIGALL